MTAQSILLPGLEDSILARHLEYGILRSPFDSAAKGIVLQKKDGPRVLVEQALQSGQMTPGGWLVAWHIKNVGNYPLWILDVRLPHSCFRSDEQKLDPMPELSPGGSFHLELSVACSEPPGTVVENAFLLLRVLWKEAAWRVFARLRVAFDKKGAPKTTTEVVTTQPVGSLSS